MVKVTRKRRSDRKHVIYCAVNVLSGDFYIGLTVLSLDGGGQAAAVFERLDKPSE